MNDRNLPSVILIKRYEPQNDCDITAPVAIYSIVDDKIKSGLKVGFMETDIVCGLNASENILELSDSLLEKTGLVPDISVNLLVKDNRLCLGPVIGAFVSNGNIRKANVQNPNFRFAELVKANREANTIVYFFSVKDVDFNIHRINGTYFNTEKQQWEKKSFPFPDVLYDRGGGTLESQKEISNCIRKSLEENRELKKINARYFFDKWDVYERLIQYPEMAACMPLTVEYRTSADLLDMLSECDTYIRHYTG